MSFITSPGVVGFTNNVNTAVPNNVIPVSFFVASGIGPNIDAAFGPKGSGSVLAQIPDNTAVGGNKRGTNSTDLQTFRILATQIASMPFGVICGGAGNRNDGLQASIVGGNSNILTGNLGFIGGGQSNSVTNRGVCGGGTFNLVSGNDAGILVGSNCVASGATSQAGGNSATTRGIHGAVAYAPNAITTVGDIQKCEYHLGGNTTNNAIPLVLTGDQAGAFATNTITLPNNAGYKFVVDVMGFAPATGQFKATKFEGIVTRNANAGTTAIAAGMVTTPIGNSAGAAVAWTITVTVDVALGGLAVTVVGDATNSVKWAVTAVTTEVTA